MTADKRAEYIESIVESLRAGYLNGHPPGTIDFDQARLSANLGLLIHEGLTANATATRDLTQALKDASGDLKAASGESAKIAIGLKNYTVVLAVATGLLVLTSGWQAYQSKRQADIAEKQPQSTTPTGSAVPVVQVPIPNPPPPAPTPSTKPPNKAK